MKYFNIDKNPLINFNFRNILLAFIGFRMVSNTIDLTKSFRNEMEKILPICGKLLVHPHTWVQESVSDLIYTFLGDWSDEELLSQLPEFWKPETAKSLALKTICQLKCKFVEREHMTACKNLLNFFFRIFKSRWSTDNDKKPELLYLVQKLNGVAAEENSDR